MDRTELTLMAAAALLVAIAIGWGLRWVYDLLNPPPPPEPIADSEWAEYAKACEAAREAALAHVGEVERELGNRLTQMQAELDAAMEGLGEARRQADYYESELQSFRAGATTAGMAVAAATAEPGERASDVEDMAPVADPAPELEEAPEETPLEPVASNEDAVEEVSIDGAVEVVPDAPEDNLDESTRQEEPVPAEPESSDMETAQSGDESVADRVEEVVPDAADADADADAPEADPVEDLAEGPALSEPEPTAEELADPTDRKSVV